MLLFLSKKNQIKHDACCIYFYFTLVISIILGNIVRLKIELIWILFEVQEYFAVKIEI